jgi:hypothetical protein
VRWSACLYSVAVAVANSELAHVALVPPLVTSMFWTCLSLVGADAGGILVAAQAKARRTKI